MALRADSSGSIYGTTNGGTPATSAPFSMGGWFRCLTTLANGTLISLGTAGQNNQRWTVTQTNLTGFNLVIRTTSTLTITATVPFLPNEWVHVMVVDVSSTNHSLFINGIKTNNTTSKAPTAATDLRWGAANDAANIHANLVFCQQGLWSVALADDDVFAMACGAPPMLFRPDALQQFWALDYFTIPPRGVCLGTNITTMVGNVGFLWEQSDSPTDIRKNRLVRGALFSTVPAAPTGRIWKLAGEGGGLAGYPRGLAA